MTFQNSHYFIKVYLFFFSFKNIFFVDVLRRNLTAAMRKCLSLRGVYLQGVKMQDTNLSGAKLQDSVFTEAFDAISAVAINPNGQYWAAASRRGEVRLWEAAGQTDPDIVREILLAEVEFALSALRDVFTEELERSNEEIARLEKTQTKQLEIT